MATSNFMNVNAQNIYAIPSSYMDMDENGNEFERYMESWDYEEMMDNIASNAGWERIEGSDNDRNFCGSYVCENVETINFGKTMPNFLQTTLTATIIMRSGYYSGANLDYEIKVEDCGGYDACLSEGYENMIDVMMENYRYLAERYAEEDGWNLGLFNMQRKNIEKWLEKAIDKMIEECEKICQENCQDELVCVGRFSNGEAVYEKANSIRGRVNKI